MSVSISGGVGSLGGAGTAQLRSRSVSLRIGPFGLTYATDQVLWRTGGAQSVAAALSGQSQETGPADKVAAASATGDATAAAAPEVAVQARQQVPQPSRTFSQELNDARVQAELYRQARQTQPVGGAQTEDAGGEGAQSAQTEGGADQSGTGQTGTGRGGSALRRAISAYLSCATCLTRSAPMLQATA